MSTSLELSVSMNPAFTFPNFHKLFNAAPGLYLVLLPDFTIVAASDAYLQATMTTREGILGRNLFEVFPDNPEDPAANGVNNLRTSLNRVVESAQPDSMAIQKYDVRRPAAEGGGFEERYWSPINSPVVGDSGVVEYVIHRVEDVTEFVRLRQSGAEQSRFTKELLDRADYMEAEVYRSAQELQETNRNLRKLQCELESRVDERAAHLETVSASLQSEVAERRKAQEALERSEAKLRQAQKLEAIGRLAGGVAHDFNNLLSVILSYSELILCQMGPKSPYSTELEQVIRAGERAADLTRQLLAFSRQQVLDPKVLDLNEILGELKRMLLRVLGEDIDLTVLPGANLGKVRVDPSQIEQVLMNLVVNARDAMPSGGKLTIATSNVSLDSAYARDHVGVVPGDYVLVSVSDNGSGMDAATQARIFEPFFTTKPQGKGTGLGLATVYGIVNQSGGHISVYSELGSGSTFRIFLPRFSGTSTRSEQRPSTEIATGNETVLLVEDSEQIRNVAVAILQRAGYHVLEAQGPGEALLISEQHPTRIHLLVTDVVMPKMNGRMLAERLVANRPDLRVLFMSGFTDDAVLHHGVLDSGMAFLQKPLTPASLTRKVREVLDASPTHYARPMNIAPSPKAPETSG